MHGILKSIEIRNFQYHPLLIFIREEFRPCRETFSPNHPNSNLESDEEPCFPLSTPFEFPDLRFVFTKSSNNFISQLLADDRPPKEETVQ